jgi:predicted RNA methylase
VTKKRTPDFSLRHAVRDPGFTPRSADVSGLVALLVDEDLRRDTERALTRGGVALGGALLAALPKSEPEARASLLRVLGALQREAPQTAFVEALVEALGDEAPRVRRAAGRALGNVGGQTIGQALSAALARETDASVLRALGEAAAKHGLEGAVAARADALGATRGKASVIASRAAARVAPSALLPEASLRSPTPVRLHCRAGLEGLLAGELPVELGAECPERGLVEARVRGSLKPLLDARLALGLGFPLPPTKLVGGEAETLAKALVSPAARSIFRTFTEGPIRYRIAWQGGEKRRALVFRAAELAAAAWPELVNDPAASPWEVRVALRDDTLDVELVPAFPDRRFAYRVGDVPAASHPTLAAALVRVGGARRDDVVWDPFVGSGLELCERALAGPYALLTGTDTSPEALAVARRNLASVGAQRVDLACVDALAHDPGSPTLVLTNPPMGMRVHRHTELEAMLIALVRKVGDVLGPGGRFVWLAPKANRMREAAQRAGLVLRYSSLVDMGGFDAELQAWEKS